jgi:hypothetical protein
VVNQLKLELKRGTNGNDEFTITHG